MTMILTNIHHTLQGATAEDQAVLNAMTTQAVARFDKSTRLAAAEQWQQAQADTEADEELLDLDTPYGIIDSAVSDVAVQFANDNGYDAPALGSLFPEVYAELDPHQHGGHNKIGVKRTFTASEEQLERLAAFAEEHDISASAAVRKLIEDHTPAL